MTELAKQSCDVEWHRGDVSVIRVYGGGTIAWSARTEMATFQLTYLCEHLDGVCCCIRRGELDQGYSDGRFRGGPEDQLWNASSWLSGYTEKEGKRGSGMWLCGVMPIPQCRRP